MVCFNSKDMMKPPDVIKTAPEDPIRKGGIEWSHVYMGVVGACPRSFYCLVFILHCQRRKRIEAVRQIKAKKSPKRV